MPKINLQSLVRPKIFWPSIIILLIACLSLYMLKEKEKSLRIAKELELQQTVEAKKVVENNLVDAKKEIIAKDEQIKLTLDKLEKEITARREAEERSLTLEKEVQDKEQQTKLTLDKLEKEITARREAEVSAILAIKENKILEARVAELKSALAPKKPIELEKIIVEATPILRGKVLMVNKEFAFIAIDLGRANNLKLGDILSIYRDGQFIGKVEVEKIEEKVSAAAILPDWQNVEFKENDEVKER